MRDPGRPDDRQRVEATVHGRVQGVGFRYHVLRAAARLDLEGWVANASDGSVRCVAEGPPAALETLLDELRAGPRGARVDHVDSRWRSASGDLGPFTVRSGGHSGD
jgi:acylphosphatase